MRTPVRFWMVLCLGTLAAAPSGATIPVIDVAALAQFIQEIAYWKEQLQGMATEVAALQQQVAIATGRRGMEALLPQTPNQRNDLPATGGELAAVMAGQGGSFGALRRDFRHAIERTTVLTPAELARLSVVERSSLRESREAIAIRTALVQNALERSSQRFASLQLLIDAIPAANDPKAIAELQARIAAEQVMLANDQSKLNALDAWADAQVANAQLRRREAVVAAHGHFADRFQPRTP